MPSRRLVVLTTAAGMLAAAAPLLTSAHADGVPADYPAAGCFTYADPADDAVDPYAGAFADSDLDITGFALDKTDTSLKAYVRVPGLTNDPASLAPFDGHRFT